MGRRTEDVSLHSNEMPCSLLANAVTRRCPEWPNHYTATVFHGRCDHMRQYEGFGDGHSKNFAEGDCEELKDAAKSMFELRRVVKFTYVHVMLARIPLVRLVLSHTRGGACKTATFANSCWRKPSFNWKISMDQRQKL